MADEKSKDQEDDNQVMIVAMRADGPAPVPNSAPRLCTQCGETIWVAPTTVKYLKENPDAEVIFRCVPCAGETLAKAKPEDLNMLPGSMEELMDALERLKDPKERGH